MKIGILVLFVCVLAVSQSSGRGVYRYFEKMNNYQENLLRSLDSVNQDEVCHASIIEYGSLLIFRFEGAKSCKGEVCKALIYDLKRLKELAGVVLSNKLFRYDYIEANKMDLVFHFADGRTQSSISYDGNLIVIKKMFQK
ncbi:MAG: hypothetical protein V7727_09405 [Sneathiella sp.]